jgi:hypothetical protein
MFGDVNQEARKTGGDQEFLEVHGFVVFQFESLWCFESLAVASHTLQPDFLSDNLDRSR